MKIEFADDRIKEYSQGMGFHLVNDGKPIDVSAANGADLLNARHLLDGEWVSVFRPVGAKPKRVAEAKQLLAGYPDNFPHAEQLANAGFTHADAVLLDKEALMAVEGIGKRGAEKVIAFHTEA